MTDNLYARLAALQGFNPLQSLIPLLVFVVIAVSVIALIRRYKIDGLRIMLETAEQRWQRHEDKRRQHFTAREEQREQFETGRDRQRQRFEMATRSRRSTRPLPGQDGSTEPD